MTMSSISAYTSFCSEKMASNMQRDLQCPFFFRPPNCPTNVKKFKKLFGSNSEKEQGVIGWLLRSKDKDCFSKTF